MARLNSKIAVAIKVCFWGGNFPGSSTGTTLTVLSPISQLPLTECIHFKQFQVTHYGDPTFSSLLNSVLNFITLFCHICSPLYLSTFYFLISNKKARMTKNTHNTYRWCMLVVPAPQEAEAGALLELCTDRDQYSGGHQVTWVGVKQPRLEKEIVKTPLLIRSGIKFVNRCCPPAGAPPWFSESVSPEWISKWRFAPFQVPTLKNYIHNNTHIMSNIIFSSLPTYSIFKIFRNSFFLSKWRV